MLAYIHILNIRKCEIVFKAVIFYKCGKLQTISWSENLNSAIS